MVTVNAHFDGKVIVPDEPLELPPEPTADRPHRTGRRTR